MEKYLSDFTEDQSYHEIKDLIPTGICPFLFYSLTPYIFTIANDGWFDWTKKSASITERKKIDALDFKRRKVNSLYVNEVLVRCPNPHTTVVVGIGPWTDNKIKLRILHCSGICSNDHKSGDEFLIDIEACKAKVLKYNASFPETLIRSFTGKLAGEVFNNCEAYSGISVQVSEIIFPCRYHKSKKAFKSDSFLPDGFCPHLYRSIYPEILAVMYNAKESEDLRIRHPGSGLNISLSIEKVNKIKSSLIMSMLNLLKWGFQALFFPVDLLLYEIQITILGNESRGCSVGENKKYLVNMKDENFLCPASFHSLYPYLMLAAVGHNVIWKLNQKFALQPCPDCVGTVYSVENQPAKQVGLG
ncbi:MAG: TIGR04076 family protein [Deltaproteobacteria bacterium]|nr:TIGR04076 family protein [Deltaproteobacteria bacterium]